MVLLSATKPAELHLLQPWRTIDLEPNKTGEDFWKTMQGLNMTVDPADLAVLRSIRSVVTKPTTQPLFPITVASLCGGRGGTLKTIYDSAFLSGFRLGPQETGPQLRIQYFEQPKNECLIVATEPISSGGDPIIFGVTRDRCDLRLSSRYANQNTVFPANCCFLFCRDSTPS